MDKHPINDPLQFSIVAISFELSLGVVAAILGWWAGRWPWETLVSLDRAGWIEGGIVGLATALLLFAGLVIVDRNPVGMFRELQETVRRLLVPLFRHVNPLMLLVISLSAGIGEELLFRGYCQDVMARWIGPPWGETMALVFASGLFGLCHWISPAYAAVATVMGLLLGGIFWATGSVVAPIIAHSLYDFLALLYLVHGPSAEKTAVRPQGHEPP